MHIQGLACDVRMIEFVRGDGSLVSYSREESPELLEGARVHLGSLGVVSRLSLDPSPHPNPNPNRNPNPNQVSRLSLDVVPYYDVARLGLGLGLG